MIYDIIGTRIADLVKKDKLKEACVLMGELAILTNNEIIKDVAVLQRGITQIEHDHSMGTDDPDYYFKKRNQLAMSILNYLENI